MKTALICSITSILAIFAPFAFDAAPSPVAAEVHVAATPRHAAEALADPSPCAGCIAMANYINITSNPPFTISAMLVDSGHNNGAGPDGNCQNTGFGCTSPPCQPAAKKLKITASGNIPPETYFQEQRVTGGSKVLLNAGGSITIILSNDQPNIWCASNANIGYVRNQAGTILGFVSFSCSSCIPLN